MNLKTLIIATLVASISFGIGAYYRLNHITPFPGPVGKGSPPAKSGDINQDDPDAPITISGRINILLIGEDNVEASRRSDTVAFVAVDLDDRNIRVLSLPRDTRILIPKHGYQKLNHAFAYGQEDLLRATVQNFLGTPIHYYVKMDYDNFPKFVDLIGGVDIYVGKAMKYRDRSQNLTIDIPVGKHHMDGELALKYVRFRHDALGDIGRLKRQQQFLKAVIHKLYEPSNMLRFAALSREITDTLKTDMPPSLTMQLCLFVKKLDKETDKIFFKMLPGHPETIDKLSYWIADAQDSIPFLNATKEQLVAMDREARTTTQNGESNLSAVSSAEDYSPDGTTAKPRSGDTAGHSPKDIMSIVTNIPEAVAVLNGTGKSGISHKVAGHLQKLGVDVVYTGNAKHFDYRTTNIIYPESATESTIKAAQLLAELCGVSPALTRKNALAVYPSLIVGHDNEKLLKRLENSYVSEN